MRKGRAGVQGVNVVVSFSYQLSRAALAKHPGKVCRGRTSPNPPAGSGHILHFLEVCLAVASIHSPGNG